MVAALLKATAAMTSTSQPKESIPDGIGVATPKIYALLCNSTHIIHYIILIYLIFKYKLQLKENPKMLKILPL